jgi:hypothetical protein
MLNNLRDFKKFEGTITLINLEKSGSKKSKRTKAKHYNIKLNEHIDNTFKVYKFSKSPLKFEVGDTVVISVRPKIIPFKSTYDVIRMEKNRRLVYADFYLSKDRSFDFFTISFGIAFVLLLAYIYFLRRNLVAEKIKREDTFNWSNTDTF